MCYHFAIFIIIIFLTATYCIERCSITAPFKRFYKIHSCHKSSLPIIGWDNFRNVHECMKFARERKGFAFNYSPASSEARNLTKLGYFRNCQVLACPEMINSTTLIQDENFDYYSAYGSLNDTENTPTCIKSIGLFSLITEKRNYSESIKYCNELGADLADILTETRTNHLALLIKNSMMSDWYKAAYVGLDDLTMRGSFVTPLNNLLGCSKFRAWSPGHPRKFRKRSSCVVLDSERTWRTVNCRIKLAFVCEFYGQAPQVQNQLDRDNVDCDF